MNYKKSDLIAFFAALCLFLSAIEYAIPKPLPFMRLGLANLPIILSLQLMNKRQTLLLVLLKILGQGFISGTLFSYIFIFSAAGSFASAFAMILLYMIFGRLKLISAVGLSLAGALANNAAQLFIAKFMLFGSNTKYIAPILLISGVITGISLGLFIQLFETKSIWFKSLGDINEAS